MSLLNNIMFIEKYYLSKIYIYDNINIKYTLLYIYKNV